MASIVPDPVTYHGAINGQRSIAEFLDAVVDFHIYPLSTPLDGWGRVSLHLAIQHGVATKGLNPVGRVIAFEDRWLWVINKINQLKQSLVTFC